MMTRVELVPTRSAPAATTASVASSVETPPAALTLTLREQSRRLMEHTS